VRADDHAALVSLALELRIDLVVVGPEAPLVAGLADELRHRGVAVFGPGAAAARIEGSKSFAKEVMDAAGVPTARTLPVARPPCVLKLDGLAAGKGVWVCRTQDELDSALEVAQAFDQPFHVEEFLEGAELTLLALAALELVHLPVLRELARRGTPFHGLLYAGLMRTVDGLRVIEFNCRFGDPETQSVLPRLESDLVPLLAGDLSRELQIANRAAVTVVLAAPDYPARSDYSGTPIDGVEEAEATGALVLHAGTALHGGRLVTNGGRILDVVGLGTTVGEARSAAYDAAARIDFAGMQFRKDIAADA
jgi:phosphoribosylamine--glycine ligase